MKTLMAVLVALVFSLAMMAQDTSNQSQSQSSQTPSTSQPSQTPSTSQPSQTPSTSQPSQSGQSSQTSSDSGQSGQSGKMSGKVSSDAKSFTDDKSGKTYTVSNPSSLQNYEGQHVVVLVHMDPDTGNLTISAVQPPQ